MGSGRRLLPAVLAASALVLGSCSSALLFDPDAPVADECPPAAGAVAAPAGALTARDTALPLDRFPLCGYQVTSEEAVGTNGWSRTFRPTDAAKANFRSILVQTFVLAAGDSAAAFVARQKPETWSWDGSVDISRLPAEVVGDAATAFQVSFGGSQQRRYIYIAGDGTYAFVLLAEPSRVGVNTSYPAALQRLLSIARSEMAFWDALALAARSSGEACNVMYDGTWTGQATYKYEKLSRLPGGPAVPTYSGAVSFTFRMQCTSLTSDAVVLRVTQASSPHPYFGAPTLVGVQGAATLPRNLPTVAAQPSDPYTISIIFPNGSTAGFLLVTAPSQRADQIAMAPGGNAGVRQMGWTAGNPTAGAAAAVFPFDPEVGFAVTFVDKGWSFAKQTGAR